MEWYTFVFLLIMKYSMTNATFLRDETLPNQLNEDLKISNTDAYSHIILENEDTKLKFLGKLLARVLLQPWPQGTSPIIFVENPITENIKDETNDDTGNIASDSTSNVPLKRSRYYRKYPWKRQNSRYEAENRYLCQPTKEDVFRLLVALHEARQGNRGQVINFCNRKRPANVIFTNIRFLG